VCWWTWPGMRESRTRTATAEGELRGLFTHRRRRETTLPPKGPFPTISFRTAASERHKNLIVSMRSLPPHEGGTMFESEQPATKSNLTTLAVVVIIVLVILLGATWLYTRA
jgi:hypothetical protein